MKVLWVAVLVFGGFFLSRAEDDVLEVHGTESSENRTKELELFPPQPTYAGQTRMPRTLFKKLHSGAAFLAGLKLGAILSKKGFELGHGKVASTHSFRVFGKPVNSAMSLSYGDAGSLLPVVDDDPESGSLKKGALNEDGKKIFHVTVIEDSFNDTIKEQVGKAEKETPDIADGNDGKGEDVVPEGEDKVEEEPENEVETNFLEKHNKMVKEFNESISKRKKKVKL